MCFLFILISIFYVAFIFYKAGKLAPRLPPSRRALPLRKSPGKSPRKPHGTTSPLDSLKHNRAGATSSILVPPSQTTKATHKSRARSVSPSPRSTTSREIRALSQQSAASQGRRSMSASPTKKLLKAYRTMAKRVSPRKLTSTSGTRVILSSHNLRDTARNRTSPRAASAAILDSSRETRSSKSRSV